MVSSMVIRPQMQGQSNLQQQGGFFWEMPLSFTFTCHWLGFDCCSHSFGLCDLSGFIHLGVTV